MALAVAVTCCFPSPSRARIALDALSHDGYGMVELERPEPNILTVLATINGRKARLIVDTGWADEGITVTEEYGKLLHSPVADLKDNGRSASGQPMVGFKRGTSDLVTVGNVQLRGVPIIFGSIGSLKHHYDGPNVHAAGYIGAGFLSTCSAIIDLHNLRLYLRPPGTGHRAVINKAMNAQGLADVPFDVIHSNCLVEVEINGVRTAMFVDTGASLANVDERFLPKMGAKARGSRVRYMDASGAEGRTKLTNLQSFKIGGVNVRAPDLRTARFGFYDETGGKIVGLLGMDILGKNGTIIDFGQKRLYFYPL